MCNELLNINQVPKTVEKQNNQILFYQGPNWISTTEYNTYLIFVSQLWS